MDIVTLFDVLMNGLLDAEEKFLSDPKDFYTLETSIKTAADTFAAGFLGGILSEMDRQIYESGWRSGRYKVQRHDTRTLISSVGDVTFDCTYYESLTEPKTYRYLLEDVVGISRHERFTLAGETMLLTEALKTSYEEAARVLPSKSRITKTTVMNKVHQIAETMPYRAPEKKKEVKCLFIEADEDHVAEQHGRNGKKEDNSGFISRLVYVYEYKQDSPKCRGRKELVNTYYLAGLYPESTGISKLWNEVSGYISSTYDEEKIETIYISGDGAGWIKAGTEHIEKSKYCLDRYHLMKYINAAAGQMLDEKELAKSEIYRMLNGRHRGELKNYLEKMKQSAPNMKPVEELERYVLGNWRAAMRSFHDKRVTGCSAEGHVSHVLSDRLSSRPMGWSQTGADRMSRLRCYERNHGREKIIDLVKYSREQRMLARTGTEDLPVKEFSMADVGEKHSSQARKYIERLQVTFPGRTARKKASIRSQLGGL